MVMLSFHKLLCGITNDSSEENPILDVGLEDEVCLIVGYKPISIGRIEKNEEIDLSHIDSIQFADSIKITLVDRDPSYFGDGDDILGRVTVRSSSAGAGEQKVDFLERGSKYCLTYSVT
jgi:hypothetical protein